MAIVSSQRWINTTRWFIAAGAVVCVAGPVLIIAKVESVLFTGPLLLLIGLATLITGNLTRFLLAALLGVAHCTICLLFFILVQVHDWSPHEARVPFLNMSLLYAILIVPVSVLACLRPPARPAEEGKCVQCGYLLHGLPEPRCPECGTRFDPAKLRGAPPLAKPGIAPEQPMRPMV
jgi:hypothetical protein